MPPLPAAPAGQEPKQHAGPRRPLSSPSELLGSPLSSVPTGPPPAPPGTPQKPEGPFSPCQTPHVLSDAQAHCLAPAGSVPGTLCPATVLPAPHCRSCPPNGIRSPSSAVSVLTFQLVLLSTVSCFLGTPRPIQREGAHRLKGTKRHPGPPSWGRGSPWSLTRAPLFLGTGLPNTPQRPSPRPFPLGTDRGQRRQIPA